MAGTEPAGGGWRGDEGDDIFMVVSPGSCWQEILRRLHGASLPSSAHGNMLKLQTINGHK